MVAENRIQLGYSNPYRHGQVPSTRFATVTCTSHIHRRRCRITDHSGPLCLTTGRLPRAAAHGDQGRHTITASHIPFKPLISLVNMGYITGYPHILVLPQTLGVHVFPCFSCFFPSKLVMLGMVWQWLTCPWIPS